MTSTTIRDNIKQVQATIAEACARVNRDPSTVTLVAVSKQHPADAIYTAIDAGLTHFGENRVGEAMEKIPEVNDHTSIKPVWHMIGHIQSRKTKNVLPIFDVVETVDRMKIARKLSELAIEHNITLPVLVEANVSGDEAKYGFELSGWQGNPSMKQQFFQQFGTMLELPNLDIRGLMTLAPYADDAETSRPVFADLRHLRDALCDHFTIELPDLSMGMSNDYPIAIEEGATIVRVGTAIFGAREY